jgi:hypothetical protein
LIEKPVIRMSLHITNSIAEWGFGKRFIELLANLGPQFFPDRVGNFERHTKPWEGVEQCHELWGNAKTKVASDHLLYNDFIWTRRRNLRSSGTVRHSISRPALGDFVPAWITAECGLDTSVDWSDFFSRFCELCLPAYGLLHLYDGIELTFGNEKVRRDHFRAGGFHWHLEQRRFPNLAWINAFGGPFREIADRGALESDGFYTQTIGDSWLLRLTPSIVDVHLNYSHFSEIRRKAKRHFPREFFLIPD